MSFLVYCDTMRFHNSGLEKINWSCSLLCLWRSQFESGLISKSPVDRAQLRCLCQLLIGVLILLPVYSPHMYHYFVGNWLYWPTTKGLFVASANLLFRAQIVNVWGKLHWAWLPSSVCCKLRQCSTWADSFQISSQRWHVATQWPDEPWETVGEEKEEEVAKGRGREKKRSLLWWQPVFFSFFPAPSL